MAYGIKCNVKAVHRFLRLGAACIIVGAQGDGGARFKVRGCSRSGRKVFAYVNTRDLENFRPCWVGESHAAWPFSSTREEAQAAADSLNQRFGATEVRPHAKGFDRSIAACTN